MKTSPSFTFLKIADIEIINEKPYVFLRDGSVSRNIILSGIPNSGFTESIYENTARVLNRAFADLEIPGIEVQFTLQRKAVNKHNLPELSPMDYPDYLLERNKFIRDILIKNNEVMENNIILSIISKPEFKDEGLVEGVKRTAKSFIRMMKNESDENYVLSNYDEGTTLTRLRKLDRVTSLLENAMKEVGCDVFIPKNRHSNLKILREYFAPIQSKYEEKNFENSNNDLRRKLLEGTRTLEMDKYFIHDEYFHRIYRLESVSADENVIASQVQKLLNAPFEFNYTVAFRVMDQEKAESRLKNKIVYASVMEGSANNGKTITKDAGLEKELVHAISAKQRMISEKACEFTAYFTYKKYINLVDKELDNAKITIDDYCSELDDILRQKYFSKMASSNWTPMMGPWELYCAISPGMLSLSDFLIKVDIEFPYDLCHILPIYDIKRYDIKFDGVNHCFTDNDSIVPFSFYDPTLNSWNVILTGDMGSGKSVYANFLIAQIRAYAASSGKKPLVRVLDFGGVAGSFYKIFEYEDAPTFNFASPKKPYINIFDVSEQYMLPNEPKVIELIGIVRSRLPQLSKLDDKKLRELIIFYFESICSFEGAPDDEFRIRKMSEAFSIHTTELEEVYPLFKLDRTNCRPNNDLMVVIQSCLETMLSPTAEPIVVDYEIDSVIQLVKEIYDNPNRAGFPKISDLYDLLRAYDSTNPLLNRLHRFTQNGDYHMFDHDTDMELDADYILYDSYGLDSHPKLKVIYSILMMHIVVNDMYKKMDRTRLFVVDEAAFALKSDPIRKVLVAFSRTSRKYKFGFVIATQKPTDFFEASHSDGKVITELASTHIYCGFGKRHVIQETINYYQLPRHIEEDMVNLGVRESDKLSYRNYARYMVVQDTKSGKRITTMKNILSPTEFGYYNSSKEENAIVRFYREIMGWKIADAVKHIVSNKHVQDDSLLSYLKQNNHLDAYDKIMKSRKN